MNKGKLFEQIARVIQESLVDSNDTIVRSNHKLKDTVGLLREYDVFVESKVNGFPIGIAIECKDYKRKVAVEKIDAFQSKCNDIPQINKKVFISKNGFQTGARAKAQLYGIDLHLLNEITESEVLKWFHINIPQPVRVSRILGANAVEFKGNGCEYSAQEYLRFGDHTVRIQDLMIEVTEKNLPQPKLYLRTTERDQSSPDSETYQFQIFFENTRLMKDDKEFEVNWLMFIVTDVFTPIPGRILFDQFKSLEGGEEISQSVSILSEDNELFSFVKKTDDEVIQIFTSSSEGSDIIRFGKMKISKKE